MIEIAIYGKGGIGKSTVSANLSAALAKGQKKVLQLGCDPKHDSTRLLLHGKDMTTVLSYMREVGPADYKLEDIIHEGVFGITCVEAGGPEPGVGCAGRGILSTFELLDRLGLDREYFDFILYDVLGDVVCGGFAVPLRQEYADRVYIVTSGEFMSIYAANNILRGLANYSTEGPRAGGIIFNERGLEEEEERIYRFACAVNLPVLAKIPRDDIFAKAEDLGKSVVEAFPDSKVGKIFQSLSEKIWEQEILYPAKPLEDRELEEVVLGRKAEISLEKTKNLQIKKEKQDKTFYSKSLLTREPLHGCAYNGAMNLAVQMKDGVTISHGPSSCANLSYQSITSLGRRALLEKGIVLPIQLHPKMMSTNMGESAMVFGGISELEETLEKALRENPKVITIVTTCPSGIIGDDMENTIEPYRKKCPIVLLPTDGNINGDYMQGMILGYQEFAKQLVKRNGKNDPYLVNIYGEKPIANSTAENIKILSKWLQAFGAKIHCRYINETETDKIKDLLDGGLHINAYGDYMGQILEEFFKKEFGITFFPHVFPIGFDDSVRFIRGLGDFYHQKEVAEKIIQEEENKYFEELKELIPILKGKKIMVVSYNHQVDWILRTALDVGMEVVKVGLLNFSQDMYRGSLYEDQVGEWEVNYTQEKRRADVARLKPDLVLANYNGGNLDDCPLHDTIQLTPQGGFESGIRQLRRLVQLFRQQIKEGWREDERFFKEYSAR